MPPADIPRPSWKIRRRWIAATLIFCAGELIYLTGWGHDGSLHEAIASGVLLLAGSILGAYIFGAAWDDRNFMHALLRALGRDPGGEG
ncbi:MAG: hypothetical protein AB1592_19315 [Pseudomonadota bacterium]